MIGDFFLGAAYLVRGLRLVNRPGLRRFALVPIVVSVCVFAAIVVLAVYGYDAVLDAWLPVTDGVLSAAARAILWIVFGLVLALVLLYVFTVVANVIASPFNGLLAERVEQTIAPGALADAESIGGVHAMLGVLATESKKLLYALLWFTFGAILTLIPGLNLLAPIYWLLMTSWILAVEYLSYPMDNHAIAFGEARSRLRRRRALTLGFGLAVLVATAVPGLNLLVMPAAVAGATALWAEQLSRPASV